MKPDWDKLMAEYKGSDSILIADVDCTTTGKDLCETIGVQGFPTIKYGDPNDLEDYEGGRSFKELAKFAKDNLGPRCSPGNLDLCDEAKKKQIAGFVAMDETELKTSITEKSKELKQIDTDVEEFLKDLQSQYEKSQKEADEKKKALKDGGLGLMKSVAAHRKITIPKVEL
jgi:hypothetical protein